MEAVRREKRGSRTGNIKGKVRKRSDTMRKTVREIIMGINGRTRLQ